MTDDISFIKNLWDDEKLLMFPHTASPYYPKNGNCWVSKDSQTGQLIFFVRASGVHNSFKGKKYQKFNTIINTKLNEGETWLICTLLDTNLQEKFDLLAKSVARGTVTFSGSELIKKSIDIIEGWAQFFKLSRVGLTNEEFIGILGELYFLSNILKKHFDDNSCISFWIGPIEDDRSNSKQDFTFNNVAIELKTTSSGGSKNIKISSKDQLERVTDRLYLINLFINETSNRENSFSLESLYKEIKNNLDDSSTAYLDFENKIKQFIAKATEEQLSKTFIHLRHIIYKVEDKFPRLDSETTPKGIFKVSYEISSNDIDQFIVKESIDDIINKS